MWGIKDLSKDMSSEVKLENYISKRDQSFGVCSERVRSIMDCISERNRVKGLFLWGLLLSRTTMQRQTFGSGVKRIFDINWCKCSFFSLRKVVRITHQSGSNWKASSQELAGRLQFGKQGFRVQFTPQGGNSVTGHNKRSLAFWSNPKWRPE